MSVLELLWLESTSRNRRRGRRRFFAGRRFAKRYWVLEPVRHCQFPVTHGEWAPTTSLSSCEWLSSRTGRHGLALDRRSVRSGVAQSLHVFFHLPTSWAVPRSHGFLASQPLCPS